MKTNLTLLFILVSKISELETQRKQAELEKRACEDLVRERDLLSKVSLLFHIIYRNIMCSLIIIGFEEIRGKQ